MPATAQTAVAVIGIDIGKNSFHVVGLDSALMHRSKWHVYSITSSAMASRFGGTVMPSTLAVLRREHERDYDKLPDIDRGLRR